MRQFWLFILALAAMSTDVRASCIDPATLVRSTVGITREFAPGEREEAPGILGIRGTGWFLAPRLLVTAAHVAEAMRLSEPDWKGIELRQRDDKVLVPVRIQRIVGTLTEKIAVLELKAAHPAAAVLPVRLGGLSPEERLVSLAYPNGALRLATGRFAEYGNGVRRAGMALIEMHDGDDRLVLDHGASGAPVIDCQGQVVAVVSTLITQTIALPARLTRVSTPWQTPNVLSIPADELKGLVSAE